ncbi:MAG: endonuclease/exonuclease/phosphatase family protein [Polyangiaceae bacterium]|nr:endonuclease/exonuclease/phosphatase family protein [Polyangiaceae bacterium]
MRARLALALALSCLALGCGEDPEASEPLPPKPLSVMTFNVLCSVCNPSEYDPWDERLDYFADLFTRHDPDLIGLQEITPLAGEVESLLATLPGRKALFFEQEDWPPYPDAAIFYRTSRFRVLERGEYWLSPTPDEPRSTGFAKPQLPRLVVWARLLDKAGDREMFFASTHFDNNSPSQELSAPLVLERTAPFAAELPVVFVGDFNSQPSDPAYKTLTTDASHGFVFQNAYDLAQKPGIVENQDPDPSFDPADRIDHVFVAGAGVPWTSSSWAADLFVYGAKKRYPSDHFAVVTTLDR